MKYSTRRYTQIIKRGFSSSCNATCNATPFKTIFTFCIFSISIKQYINRELSYTERQNEEIIKRLNRIEEKMSESKNK
jgi:hypothetical protein